MYVLQSTGMIAVDLESASGKYAMEQCCLRHGPVCLRCGLPVSRRPTVATAVFCGLRNAGIARERSRRCEAGNRSPKCRLADQREQCRCCRDARTQKATASATRLARVMTVLIHLVLLGMLLRKTRNTMQLSGRDGLAHPRDVNTLHTHFGCGHRSRRRVRTSALRSAHFAGRSPGHDANSAQRHCCPRIRGGQAIQGDGTDLRLTCQ